VLFAGRGRAGRATFLPQYYAESDIFLLFVETVHGRNEIQALTVKTQNAACDFPAMHE
jgi:hypothetical protein